MECVIKYHGDHIAYLPLLFPRLTSFVKLVAVVSYAAAPPPRLESRFANPSQPLAAVFCVLKR